MVHELQEEMLKKNFSILQMAQRLFTSRMNQRMGIVSFMYLIAMEQIKENFKESLQEEM
jgi:hypothetical protein